MKKYLLTFSVITLVLTLALCGCGPKPETPQTEGSQTKPSQSQETPTESLQPAATQPKEAVFTKPENYTSVVQVAINPTVNLYLDADEVILAVEYVNEDAKTSYKKIETELVGAKLNDGVNTVIETAKADGYLAENVKVTIDVVETKETEDKLTILESVSESAKSYLTENNIQADILLTEESQKELDDKKTAQEKEAKNPIKNLKFGVEYSLIKPGEDEALLTGVHITFAADGSYKYGMAPYLNDEFGEGEYIIYNGKKYYVAGGGGGAGTYTMTDERITMAGAYDMVLTMTVEGELVVEKADSGSDFFAVGDKLTKE